MPRKKVLPGPWGDFAKQTALTAPALAIATAVAKVGLASIARDLENAWRRPNCPSRRQYECGDLRELVVQSNAKICLEVVHCMD